jgi:hypothetical protein
VITSLGVTFNVDSARRKNLRAVSASRRAETSTSMICPCWSTARYTYRHTPLTLTYVVVDEPPVAGRVTGESGRVGQQRREALHPSVDGDVVDLDPALDQ